MSNPLNPSFRYPGSIPSDAAHPKVIAALRSNANSITDINQAIASLKSQISTPSASTTSTGTSSSGSGATENVTNLTISGGVVNNQTGVTAYTTQQGDDGALVILGDSSAIAVTLNNAVTLPWYASLSNAGKSVVTVTPQLGTINGSANLTLPAGSWVTVYFDGSNFWAESPGSTAGGVTSVIAGTNVTISPPSGVGSVTINSSGGGGGVTQIIGGSGIGVSPAGGTGVVTLTATGGGGYSLGGTLANSNLVVSSNAGIGATGTVNGLDGNHVVTITTGSSGVEAGSLYTITFTTPRGHSTYPIIQGLAGVDATAGAASATAYTASTTGGLAPSTTYSFNVSCP